MGKMGELWAEGRADRLECDLSDLSYEKYTLESEAGNLHSEIIDLRFENHMLLFENKVLKKTIEDTRNMLSTYDNTRENNIEYLKYIGCAITQKEHAA